MKNVGAAGSALPSPPSFEGWLSALDDAKECDRDRVSELPRESERLELELPTDVGVMLLLNRPPQLVPNLKLLVMVATGGEEIIILND